MTDRLSWLLCLLHKQCQGLQICEVIYYLGLLDDRNDRTNQLYWLKLLHTSYISLLNQVGKGRVFYSVDKCFETGADLRIIFDKQILKVWTPSLSAFYCVISRATLAQSLKVRAIARFSKSARARSKNYREPP